MSGNPKLRFLYVTWAFVECVLFGGILYGWGSLNYILIEEGVFSELCDGYVPVPTPTENSDAWDVGRASASQGVGGGEYMQRQNQNCPARDKRFALVFTVACVSLCVGTAAMGQVNFKYGTRLTRVLALVTFTFGALLTAFTSHDLPWLVFPGLSLLGVGGMPLLITNTQFSMLFNRGSSTVVSILSGAFDTSSGVTLVLKIVYDRGVSLRWSMLVIACAHLLTVVNTFFFLPEGFISKVVPDPVTLDVKGASLEGLPTEREAFNEDGDDENKPLLKGAEEKEEELPSIRSCILSPLYIFHVLWLSILQLRFYYLIGSLNSWLSTLFTSKDDVSFYTSVCQYAMMFGLVSSLFAGIVYDINKWIFDDSRSLLRRDLMPAVVPQALTTLLAIVLSCLVLLDSTSVLYPIFIVNVIFRSFMYSLAASYIGVMFPSEYFGVLYGVMIIVGGTVGMGQYGLFAWSQSSGFTTVNIFLIAFLAVSLVHPLYQWITCRRAESIASRPDGRVSGSSPIPVDHMSTGRIHRQPP